MVDGVKSSAVSTSAETKKQSNRPGPLTWCVSALAGGGVGYLAADYNDLGKNARKQIEREIADPKLARDSFIKSMGSYASQLSEEEITNNVDKYINTCKANLEKSKLEIRNTKIKWALVGAAITTGLCGLYKLIFCRNNDS